MGQVGRYIEGYIVIGMHRGHHILCLHLTPTIQRITVSCRDARRGLILVVEVTIREERCDIINLFDNETIKMGLK